MYDQTPLNKDRASCASLNGLEHRAVERQADSFANAIHNVALQPQE